MFQLTIQTIKELIAALTLLTILLFPKSEEPKLGAILTAEEIKLTQIAKEQDDYFKIHGKYKGYPDGKFGDSPKYSYSVFEYAGPKGAGYVVTLVEDTAITVRERVVNYGPEIYRDRPWRITADKTWWVAS